MFDLADNTAELSTSDGCGLCWLLDTVGAGCTVRLGTVWLCTESLMGLLDTEATDLLRGCVDRSGLSIDGLAVSGLAINGLAINGLTVDGSGLSIDWLSVNWLNTIGGWSSVNDLGPLLDVSWLEAILSLSLSLTHLTKESNRSLLLCSSVVEATNEAEVHRLKERMVMDIGTLTSFFTLDILLGRGSVVVRDGLVFLGILLLLFAILISLSESTINAGSEILV